MRNHLPAKPGAASGHSGHSGQVFVLVWGVSHGSKTRVKGMGEGPLWQRFNIAIGLEASLLGSWFCLELLFEQLVKHLNPASS